VRCPSGARMASRRGTTPNNVFDLSAEATKGSFRQCKNMQIAMIIITTITTELSVKDIGSIYNIEYFYYKYYHISSTWSVVLSVVNGP
jgi:hypothetical protein